MKAFLLSALALVVLCLLVIWNSHSISKITAEMDDIARNIDSLEDEGKLNELEKAWEKHKLLLSISVPHKETDELEKNLVVLRKKFDEGIDIEIDETVALTVRAIEEIRIHAIADLNNVF